MASMPEPSDHNCKPAPESKDVSYPSGQHPKQSSTGQEKTLIRNTMF